MNNRSKHVMRALSFVMRSFSILVMALATCFAVLCVQFQPLLERRTAVIVYEEYAQIYFDTHGWFPAGIFLFLALVLAVCLMLRKNKLAFGVALPTLVLLGYGVLLFFMFVAWLPVLGEFTRYFW